MNISAPTMGNLFDYASLSLPEIQPRGGKVKDDNRSGAAVIMMTHAHRSLRETFPARASEWALSVALLIWGFRIMFVAPLNYFATSPAWHTMEQIMSQPAWAVTAIMVGTARLLMLSVNGAWRRSPHLRVLGSFLSCGVWFFISMGLYTSGDAITSLSTYPVMFALDGWNFFAAVNDAATVDRHEHDKAKVADPNGKPGS